MYLLTATFKHGDESLDVDFVLDDLSQIGDLIANMPLEAHPLRGLELRTRDALTPASKAKPRRKRLV